MLRHAVQYKQDVGLPLQKVRILFAEDSNSDIFYVRRMLEHASQRYDYEITDVPTLLEAIRKLNSEEFDLVMLDLGLLDINGVVTVSALRAEVPDVPIIVYSGIHDRRIKEKALRCGAACFLVKGYDQGIGLNAAIEKTLDWQKLQ
jgi:DNA-binding NarL/FixJ family response regulator